MSECVCVCVCVCVCACVYVCVCVINGREGLASSTVLVHVLHVSHSSHKSLKIKIETSNMHSNLNWLLCIY